MTRRLIPLALAVVLAVLGTTAVVLYVRSADTRALAGQKAVSVLVATQKIPTGTTGAQIRSGGYVEVVRMPASSVPANVLPALPRELDKLVVTSDVAPSQLMLRGMFGDAVVAVTGSGLPVPNGKVAVSVDMQLPALVAGYVVAGSKIAIFDTFTVVKGSQSRIPSGEGLARREDAKQATRLLLSKVDVIAIGARGEGSTAAPGAAASPAANGGDAAAGTEKAQSANALVTVALNQADAERLILASQTGTLYLALIDDASAIKPGAGVDNLTLFP
jgi:pilus assembly protein CpaB